MPLGDNVEVSLTVGDGMKAGDTSGWQVLAPPGMVEKRQMSSGDVPLDQRGTTSYHSNEQAPYSSSDLDDATEGI